MPYQKCTRRVRGCTDMHAQFQGLFCWLFLFFSHNKC